MVQIEFKVVKQNIHTEKKILQFKYDILFDKHIYNKNLRQSFQEKSLAWLYFRRHAKWVCNFKENKIRKQPKLQLRLYRVLPGDAFIVTWWFWPITSVTWIFWNPVSVSSGNFFQTNTLFLLGESFDFLEELNIARWRHNVKLLLNLDIQ